MRKLNTDSNRGRNTCHIPSTHRHTHVCLTLFLKHRIHTRLRGLVLFSSLPPTTETTGGRYEHTGLTENTRRSRDIYNTDSDSSTFIQNHSNFILNDAMQIFELALLHAQSRYWIHTCIKFIPDNGYTNKLIKMANKANSFN